MSVSLLSQTSQNDRNNETRAGLFHSQGENHNLQLYVYARLEKFPSHYKGSKKRLPTFFPSLLSDISVHETMHDMAINIKQKTKKIKHYSKSISQETPPISSLLIPSPPHPIPSHPDP